MPNDVLKIAVGGDWHYGITSPAEIRTKIGEITDYRPDLVIMTGDASGHLVGHKGVSWEVSQLRLILGDNIPIVTVLGNHDIWAAKSKNGGAVPLSAFLRNAKLIQWHCQVNNIHCLDFCGVFSMGSVAFVGCGGWYVNPAPPTNDAHFLPIKMPHSKMLESQNKLLADNLQALDAILAQTSLQEIVFVSHFPVINTGDDWKGSFEDFSWSSSIGDLLKNQYNCRHFICGHSHRRSEGELLVWNAGSDYYKPDWLKLEIKTETEK